MNRTDLIGWLTQQSGESCDDLAVEFVQETECVEDPEGTARMDTDAYWLSQPPAAVLLRFAAYRNSTDCRVPA